jgi:hypothetical protein
MHPINFYPRQQDYRRDARHGSANADYIYSDRAYSHLTFQVIGSRLKPGCAESKIVDTVVGLMHRTGP